MILGALLINVLLGILGNIFSNFSNITLSSEINHWFLGLDRESGYNTPVYVENKKIEK